MFPTVTVIVPVYNARATLPRCVDSILNQTYPHLEILLVDDGSTDPSPALCDAYAARDSRVRVIHKENGGVSSARNLALDLASGSYIQFVDSDDWLTPDATGRLVRAAREDRCDLVLCDFYRVSGDRLSAKGCIEEDGVMTREEFAAHMMENPSDFYYGVLWNKLYRADLIAAHRLRMDPAVSWCEDFLFNLEYIRWSDRFRAIHVPLYYYVKTKGSLVAQGMSIPNTIRMKLSVFEYYHRLYREILDEEEYQRQKLKVYSFLVDAAGDGIVPPALLPGVRKLGKERVTVPRDLLEEEGILARIYRERKLLTRCLESTAIEHDLSPEEALVLLALGRDGFVGRRQDLAELAGVSRATLTLALRQLTSRELLHTGRGAVQVLPSAFPVLNALEAALEDRKQLRWAGLTKEELEEYLRLSARIAENVRKALQ